MVLLLAASRDNKSRAATRESRETSFGSAGCQSKLYAPRPRRQRSNFRKARDLTTFLDERGSLYLPAHMRKAAVRKVVLRVSTNCALAGYGGGGGVPWWGGGGGGSGAPRPTPAPPPAPARRRSVGS